MGVSVMDKMAVHVMECFDLQALKAWGAVVVVFLITVSYACISKLRNRRLPPGPYPWPIFGNLFSLGTDRHLSLAHLADRYGNIMCVYLGNIRTIVLSDAKMAKELFSVSDPQFASRPIHNLMYTTSKYVNQAEHDCDVTASLYTPKVRELRMIMRTELFGPRKLDTTAQARKEEVVRMVEAIESCVSAGQPVNFKSVVSEFAVRQACRILFNKLFVHCERSKSEDLQPQDFSTMEREFHDLFAAPNIFGDVCLSVLRCLDLQGLEKRWRDFIPRKDKRMALLLDWYRKQATEDPVQLGSDELPEFDFVESLLEMTKKGKLSEETVKGLTLILVLAGTDTIGATLEWAMLELVCHPNILQRLQSELDSNLELGQHLEEDLASQLPYLQAVVNEVIRLHPAGTLNIPHCNTEDAMLGGYHIPAGTTVLTNVWAINRDPAMWGEDASAFNPDRYLNLKAKDNAYGQDFHLLGFGAGRRICPGKAFAITTLCSTLGSLVHAFNWSGLQGAMLPTIQEPNMKLTVRPLHPVALECKSRPRN